MKQLTCEMCGSTELVKEDGYFVCQTCGTKYSVEEAKKMMIEGTVDVQGTVKVDNSDFVKKYLANARRAMSKEDWEETEKYYNMVEQNAPDNIEAIFYSSYAKVMQLLIDSDYYKREAAFNVLIRSVSIIDDNYSNGDISTVIEISSAIFKLTSSSFIYTYKKNGYGAVVESDQPKTEQLFKNLHKAWIESLNNIVNKSNEISDLITLHNLIIIHSKAADYFGYIFTVSEQWLYDNDADFKEKKDQENKRKEELEKSRREHLKKTEDFTKKLKDAYSQYRKEKSKNDIRVAGFILIVFAIFCFIAGLSADANLAEIIVAALPFGIAGIVLVVQNRSFDPYLLNKLKTEYEKLANEAKLYGINVDQFIAEYNSSKKK